MKNIIIDTDPGCDDMLALLLMCATPDVEVLAVTTVAGNVSLQKTTNNARFILNLAGCEDVPVYSGAKEPLRRKLETASVHGVSGLGGVNVSENTPLNGLAVDEIIRLVRDNPDEITLLILGPETNIANAILQNSETMKRVKEFVIMGGAFDVPGNHNGAEFNLGVDLEAAAIVANFPVLKTYVPLDLCNDIQVPLAEFERIKSDAVRSAIITALTPYIRNIQNNELPTKGALMYDVLAAYYIACGDECEVEVVGVRVDSAIGKTLKDEKGKNTKIATNADEEVFVDFFIDSLSRL